MSAFGDRWLRARAGVAFVLANARFWSTVAPLVSTQLRRWEQRAQAIDNPSLHALALEKLRDEHFNSEVAATLATLAPRKHRRHVVEAIVAYEVMYDYLDGLTERTTVDPLRTGRELYQAFTDAIIPHEAKARYYFSGHLADDGGYLEDLVQVVRGAVAQLPSANAVSATAVRAAARCAEAQVRAHAAPRLGTAQLEQWATIEAANTALGWREFLTGAASSVLAVHALIATAAAERTTTDEAIEIDAVYLSICALSTLLDSIVDYDSDMDAGQVGYLRYYEDRDLLTRDLASATQRAVEHAAPLRNGPHHVMTLVGVVAYYLSAPTASSKFARPLTKRIRRELRPLITPTLAILHAWRTAKRLRTIIANRADR